MPMLVMKMAPREKAGFKEEEDEWMYQDDPTTCSPVQRTVRHLVHGIDKDLAQNHSKRVQRRGSNGFLGGGAYVRFSDQHDSADLDPPAPARKCNGQLFDEIGLSHEECEEGSGGDFDEEDFFPEANAGSTGKRVRVQANRGIEHHGGSLGWAEGGDGDLAEGNGHDLALSLWKLNLSNGLSLGDAMPPHHRASAGQAELLGSSQKPSPQPEIPVSSKRLSRSHSSPSLSPNIEQGPKKDKPIEIVGGISCAPAIKSLMEAVAKALENGVSPSVATGGLGGAYYFKDLGGNNVAIVKPIDEEPLAPNNPNGYVGRSLGQPGLKKAIRVGEAGVREVAAYLLDHGGFANVPRTVLVKCAHPIFHVAPGGASRSKVGSFQEYKVHDFDCSEHGTSRFPPGAVHRIGILDVRLFNTDRHSGNILVRRLRGQERDNLHRRSSANGMLGMYEAVELIPIDHGFCLPETLEAAYFEWLHWPQAAHPFSPEELSYIASLDVQKDIDLLRRELFMLREASLRTLVLSTMLLQMAAAQGLTLAEIGGLMSRDCAGMDEEASELELICMIARQRVEEEATGVQTPRHSDSASLEEDDSFVEQFQLDLDGEDETIWTSGLPDPGSVSPFRSPSPGVSGGCHCSPPMLTLEEGPEDEFPAISANPMQCLSAVGCGKSAFSSSYRPGIHRAASLFQRRPHKPLFKIDVVDLKGASAPGGHAPGDQAEEADLAMGPVVLGDMGGRTWQRFLEVVSELLSQKLAAFAQVNNARIARLGTSCQF